MSEPSNLQSRLRKWFRNRAKPVVVGPPEGAHGRRNIDGGYFSIWMCPHGHGHVGNVEQEPDRSCVKCAWDLLRNEDVIPAGWRRATPKEAHDFLFELEGFRIYDNVGYELLKETSHAT